MDDSLYYELQNQNTAKDAEIATLRRENEELKKKLTGTVNDLFAGPEMGARVWCVFPIYDFGSKRIYWEIASDHKYFVERNGLAVLYRTNKHGAPCFATVKSDYVLTKPELAKVKVDELNKRDKEKTYEEWKDVREGYNVKLEEIK